MAVARRAQRKGTDRKGVRAVLASLEHLGSKSGRDGLARYGIVAPKSFGVSMGGIQGLAKELGRDHALAQALWKSGWYEARLLAAYVDEPERVTPVQMERWAKDFDNWGVTDTLCFVLFTRTPHALAMARKWARREGEFEKRAAFALIACLALRGRETSEPELARCLPLIARAASDERNFVKKGVSWGLRSIGHRSVALHRSAVTVARKLAASEDATERWVGKDALRDLTRPKVAAKLRKRGR